MSNSKDEILARIRAGKPASQPLPDVPMYPYEGSPIEGFISKLVGFDGRAVKFRTRDDALKWLNEQPELAPGAKAVYSTLDDLKGSFTEADLSELRDAHKIDVCVTEGEMGVGEMGAIWVTDESLRHAVCALLARRLFILLDAEKIQGGMHQAYAALKLGAQQYGSFFTGPSATADIEAVRITGAQGPIKMTALIYNCEDAKEPPELIVNPNTDNSPWLKVVEEPD